jgi:hypothetical protein
MYEKQGFYSGEKLKATQLVAMEDGIIQAQEDVRNICYEDNAYEPIVWDGEIEDREKVDVSHLMGAEAGTGAVFMVKLSDIILTTEDYIGSTVIVSTPDGDRELIMIESDLIPTEESTKCGAYGQPNAIVSIFNTNLMNSAFNVNVQSAGTYSIWVPEFAIHIKSLSKTTIKKIDEKFLPELASGANMEKGTGVEATQQVPRSAKTNKINAQGQLCFEGDSPYMTLAENAEVPFGALAEASVSLGGRTSAQNTHSMAVNSKTIAKGEESLATGYATIAAGGASFSGGSQTIARAEASTALGHKNDAAAPYTFVHGVQNIAGGLYQAVFGVANANNTNNLFEIGNGKLDENGNVIERVNAFAVTRDGRVKVQNLDVNTYEENDLVPMAVMAQGLKIIEADRYIQNGGADGSVQTKYGTASAVGAAAFGTHTQANAEASMACGAHTIADQYAQTVVGKYNRKSQRSGSVFVVGGGDSNEYRRNALEVMQDGEIIIRWEGNYYSLNSMLNLISNAFVKGTAQENKAFFDAAKKQ